MNTIYQAHKMDINKLAAARMRGRYLLEEIETYEKDGSDIALVWAREALDELFTNYEKATYVKKSSISEMDVETARRYPIEELISFQNGKAMAWCHQDKAPSLCHWKKANKARCFPCNITYDPIAVLMDRNGYSFIDAVKALR